MKKSAALFSTVILSILICSCIGEMDTQKILDIVKNTYPIDTVDTRHEWNLLQTTTRLFVTADIDEQVSRIQILSDDPYSSTTAEILAEKFAQRDERVSMSFELPITKAVNTCYAAAVSRSGKYYVVPIGNSTEVNFSSGNVVSQGTLNAPAYQTFTYLFEEDYPLPGDFDYNDVVLRISKEIPSANILKIKVTLAAVGSQSQIGAAIRISNIPYTSVEEVTIDEGVRFDADYPYDRYYIDKKSLWVKGRDGSTVINLFDDAHWSLNPKSSNGTITRMYYNVSKTEKEDVYSTVNEKTLTYSIRMKDDNDVSYFMLSDLDPFIIVNNNGLNTEVHTYVNKYTEAIWHYTTGKSSKEDHVAWALLIPDASFHYPIEGNPIGRYRNGEIYGAYSRYNHSFGQWGRNCQSSLDWWHYDYATKAQVY